MDTVDCTPYQRGKRIRNRAYLVVALFLIFPPVSYAQARPSDPTPTLPVNVMRLIPSIQKPDYDKSVLQPLHAAQKIQADKQVALDAEAARQALEASQLASQQADAAAIVEQSGAIPLTPPTMAVGVYSSGDLIGSVGYSLPYGNCVLEPGVNNPGWGNPIDWPATSYAPWIGASALFYTNHVAVVVGIYSNGDLEVRQQNSPGMPHRIPMGMIRGFR